MLHIRNLSVILIMTLITVPTISESALDPIKSVYSIPYLSTYRLDLIQKSMGCGLFVMYSSYTHPQGIRDAAHIVVNPYLYGGGRCQPKQMYLKAFGYAQRYQALETPLSVSEGLKRAVSGKFKGIVIDWKNPNGQKSVQFLDGLINQLSNTGLDVYLKVPASYICKTVRGRYFIENIPSAKKVIVQMYGQDPHAYKTSNQIAISQMSEDPTTEQYPESRCPKFPSYLQLTRVASSVDFYIEKTLKQQEDGFLGDQLQKVLLEISSTYDKKIFYDDYPPSIIRL